MSKAAGFMLGCVLVMWALVGTVRGEERFPPPEFRTTYTIPNVQLPAARSEAWQYVDIAALAVALSLAAYFVLKLRSRRAVFLLMVASLVYFGFWRKGCVCSIGSIQNVTYAAFNWQYALPWVVAAFFLLPLVFTLFFGRVFCSSVCPIGAIQDVVLWRSLQLPYWLDASLGLFAFAYLGFAVLLAATGSDFVICQYDPFVSFFRLSGPAHMLFLGASFLIAGMFVGRIYCRFVCPYGVLLKMIAPFAKWRVSITPDKCIDCRLCEQACPFNAIRQPAPQRTAPVSRRDRLRLLGVFVLIPTLPTVLAWVGYRAGPTVALLDPVVKLARVVHDGAADASWHMGTHMRQQLEAFHASGRSAEDLYRQAGELVHRFTIGTAWLGVWMGAVIVWKLWEHAVRRKNTQHMADAATCLSCARCYKLCPVGQPLAAGSSLPVKVLDDVPA